VSLMHQYFMVQPLFFSTCLQRFGIEWTSLTRWSLVTTRFLRQWATRSALAC